MLAEVLSPTPLLLSLPPKVALCGSWKKEEGLFCLIIVNVPVGGDTLLPFSTLFDELAELLRAIGFSTTVVAPLVLSLRSSLDLLPSAWSAR